MGDRPFGALMAASSEVFGACPPGGQKVESPGCARAFEVFFSEGAT